MTTQHPTERASSDSPSPFERVAERASNFTSSPAFFGLCLLLIVAWAASYALGLSSTLSELLGFGMTAVTLLLLALLKNSELRSEHAIQVKLDELIRVSKAQNSFIGLEHLTEEELEEIRRRCEERAKAEARAGRARG